MKQHEMVTRFLFLILAIVVTVVGCGDESAAKPTAGEALTASTIVGTSWDFRGMSTVTFEADGVLKAEKEGLKLTGEWAIDGNTLTVRIPFDDKVDETQLQIEGDKITGGGIPFTRIR